MRARLLNGKGLKKALVISTVVLMMPLSQAFADDPGGGGVGGDPDQTAVPIDGGLSLLLAAGAGVGAYKAYKHKKQQKSTSEK